MAGEGSGATEVARHRLLPPGQASIRDEHYPNRAQRDPLHRSPRPTKPSEAAFLALGEGARLYLVEAVALAALHGADAVDRALGTAAMVGRFGEGDLGSIIVHAAGAVPGPGVPPPEHSLAAGTAMWSALGLGGNDEEER